MLFDWLMQDTAVRKPSHKPIKWHKYLKPPQVKKNWFTLTTSHLVGGAVVLATAGSIAIAGAASAGAVTASAGAIAGTAGASAVTASAVVVVGTGAGAAAAAAGATAAGATAAGAASAGAAAGGAATVAGAGAGAAGIGLAAGASALLVKYGLKARPLNQTNIMNPETEKMLTKEVNSNANSTLNPYS